jgi:hypothetical protein
MRSYRVANLTGCPCCRAVDRSSNHSTLLTVSAISTLPSELQIRFQLSKQRFLLEGPSETRRDETGQFLSAQTSYVANRAKTRVVAAWES